MKTRTNDNSVWLSSLPLPALNANKYDRGHAVIFGAPSLTGATRLAATACSRIGAGLVSVIAPIRGDVYRAALPADIMVHDDMPQDKHLSAILGGPGGMLPQHMAALMDASGVPRILDAGALRDAALWGKLDKNCVLTPHRGEFERVFGPIKHPQTSVREAAKLTGAIIVLKGPTTHIAHPSGTLVSHDQPNPYLAKAGTGDVLAGMITGLVTQNMPAFEAACSAVWMHGEAANRIGPGLVAPDIEREIPQLLAELLHAQV